MAVRAFACALIVCVAIGLPAPAGAQYFGRNKVEYSDFHFRILATEHFDLYFYEREEPAARMAGQLAERWYARFAAVLHHQLEHRQPLVLYGSQAEFAQTNVVSGLLPDSVGGVTDAARRRIVMPFAPTLSETNRVLGHEIVHAFQFDIARRYGGGTTQPLWFVEGMAEYMARGSLDIDSSLWLRDAVLHDQLPKNAGAAARHLSPYLYGHAFWAYLARAYGDDVMEKALKPGRKERRLKDRMRRATGKDLDALYIDWRADAAKMYSVRREAARLNVWNRDSMQLGPSLSPDGSQAIFFSERDRLSMDLYLADVPGRKVIRRLATTTASAKFDSLQPLRSAGAWSPDGQWFAFAAVRQGRASLMLIDVATGQRDREISFDNVSQVLSPAWSPDGRSIAVSALAGGFTDLYLCDVASGKLTRLTDDAYADLQPSWSHDGRQLAFATERFSSDWSSMRFGRPRLATLDVATRQVSEVRVDTTSTQLNPYWSIDDEELVFVGDAHGAMNVFAVAVASGVVRQITNVATGIAGITPSSPSLTLSADATTLGVTVFDGGRPHFAIVQSQSAIAQEVDRGDSRRNADASPTQVDALLADAQSGLPAAASIPAGAYAPHLSLEGVGQPYLSTGGGPFGTFVRGGGALLFGDMLGERRVGAAVQVGNRLQDAAFAIRFLNQERRWNWGLLAELEPAIARYRTAAVINEDGQPAWSRTNDYFQRFQLRTGAFVAYPFNRGLRVEFTGAVRQAMYQRDVRSQVASIATGKILRSAQAISSGGDPTTLAEIGAALVHDTTVFGPTGPIVGMRYRLEALPTTGELTFTTVSADVRRYFMPIRPYTIAVRLLHTARYGVDSNDPRLMSSYLGSNNLVRGHTDDLRYCVPAAGSTCGDDLLGNRLLVGNVEVRAPLWGIRTRQLDYGPIPVDVFAFADAGTVWHGTGQSTRITSLGGGLRVNALGLPVEMTATRAADGPRPRWFFDFGFRVGF